MQANLPSSLTVPIVSAFQTNYVDRFLPLFCGDGRGETCLLDMSELPADAYLQNQRWEEMLTNFEVAVTQASVHFGLPSVRVRDGQPEAAIWNERTSLNLKKLAAWQNEQHYFFIALESKPDSPIRLTAGRT